MCEDWHEQDQQVDSVSCRVVAYFWMRCIRLAKEGFVAFRRIVSSLSLLSVNLSSSLLQSSSSSSKALIDFLDMPNLTLLRNSNRSLLPFLGLATSIASKSFFVS